jgi:signal transduction histidine kinase
MVGHDLRNPLNAMVMGVEILKTALPEDSSSGNLVRRLDKSASRMSRMIEQLLDHTRARIGSGIPVARREIDLTALVVGVIEELALAFPSAKVELAASEPIRGLWDPDRIAQVVSNLLSNAIQYGRPDAPIKVELSSAPTSVTIAITNQIRDMPIPAEDLATLFEPYRRGPDRGQQTGGLGLGLYIVRELVRAHGGTIEASSTTAGTTFSIRMPRTRTA